MLTYVSESPRTSHMYELQGFCLESSMYLQLPCFSTFLPRRKIWAKIQCVVLLRGANVWTLKWAETFVYSWLVPLCSRYIWC